MGRVLLVGRLAARDLRRRPVEAALLLLAIMAATTTLTLGLVLHDVASDPYQRTREATAGPDVVASIASGPPDGPAGRPLAGLGGADRRSRRRRPQRTVPGHRGGSLKASRVELADGAGSGARRRAGLGRPARADPGQLGSDGGVVVEAAFADALDVGDGDPDHPERPVVPSRRRGRHRRQCRPIRAWCRRARRQPGCSTARCASPSPCDQPQWTVPNPELAQRRRDASDRLRASRPGLAHPGGRPRPRARPGIPVLRDEPEAGRPGRRPGVRRRATRGGPTRGRRTSLAVVAGDPRTGRPSWPETSRGSC